MNNLSIFLSFALGAAAGSLIGWKIAKDKYERLVDQEVAELKQRYLEEYGEPEETQEVEDEEGHTITLADQKEADIKEYAAKLAKEGYVNYSDGNAMPVKSAKPKKKETFDPDIIIVDPTDYDDEYEIVTLNYYSDDVLTDTAGEIIEDGNLLVGRDLAELFADGVEDSIYIRNKSTKIEYEILYDHRRFSDIKKKTSKPQ